MSETVVTTNIHVREVGSLRTLHQADAHFTWIGRATVFYDPADGPCIAAAFLGGDVRDPYEWVDLNQILPE